MSNRGMVRSGVPVLGALFLTGALAACGTREPPPDLDAPPTPRESRILGVDAMDSYFLTRYRKCIQFKSEQMCQREPYGDDGSGFQ
jgi:hypothetical protein